MIATSTMSGTLRSVARALGQDGRRHQLEHRVLRPADATAPCSGRPPAARRCDPSARPVCSPGMAPGAAAGGRPPTHRPGRRSPPRATTSSPSRSRTGSDDRRARARTAGRLCSPSAADRSRVPPDARAVEPSGDGRRDHRVPARRAVLRVGCSCRSCAARCGGPPGRRAPPWWAPPDRLDARATRARGSCGAAVPGRRLPQHAVHPDGRLRRRRVRRVRGAPRASPAPWCGAASCSRSPFVIFADRVGRRRCWSSPAFCAPILCALGALAPVVRLAHGHADARPAGRHHARAPRRHRGRRGDAAELPGLRRQPAGDGHRPRRRASRDGRCPSPTSACGAGASCTSCRWCSWCIAVDLARRLPESRRFEVRPRRSHRALARGRFALLAASGFALNLLVAPASFFQNRYLKDVRGYSASLHRPLHAGDQHPGRRRRDRRRAPGRHPRTAAASPSSPSSAARPSPWPCSSSPACRCGWPTPARPSSAGPTCPALGVYTAELFPTGRRGIANGLIAAARLLGSSVGLLVAGRLLDQGVGYGPVMALLAAGPLVVAVLVAVGYPETAHLDPRGAQPRGPGRGRCRRTGASAEAAQEAWPRLTPPRRRRPSGRGDRRRSRRG